MQGTAAKHGDDDGHNEEEFTYDSDSYDEAIDIGHWNNKRGGRSRCKDVEEVGEVEEFDGDNGSNDGGNDNNNIIIIMEDESVGEEEEGEDEEGESCNGLQREMEREAAVAGIRHHGKEKSQEEEGE